MVIWCRVVVFKTKKCIEYRGARYCNDDVSLFLSRARTIISYYSSDCDIDNIISDTILTNDFNLIDFVKANLSSLRLICNGEVPELNMTMLESYAREAVKRAVEEYLSNVRRGSEYREESCS